MSEHAQVIAPEFAEYVPAAPRRVEIEAESLRLKVGSLDVDLNAVGMGTVRLDGRKVKCRALSVDVVAGCAPKVVLEILPLPSE